MNNNPQTKNSPIILILLIIVLAWLINNIFYTGFFSTEATPRAITARGDLANDEKNTINIFESVSPSVVYITSIELRRGLFNLNVYKIPKGTGSGFIWDKEGRIVTNYHVIEDANQVAVTLADHSTWKAELVGAIPDKDIAVLKIKAPASILKAIPIGQSSSLLVGQKVFAIGNPFGLDQTMTSGIVSALGREIKATTNQTIQNVIQTDAAINPGNSGGPLLDSAGRLIGINTAIYSTSGNNAGIGFAVPVDIVNRVVPDIIRYGKVIRPSLGISVANKSLMKKLKIKGVLIINIQQSSAADNAKLQGTRQVKDGIILGDIIQSINGHLINNYDDLRNQLDQYRKGDNIQLGFVRDQKKLEVDVILD
ncbi:MAG: trypsin-like serine protease [Methylococcales bacterium]|jgi:S1-C subfamily serine protease|nr:trypsin-like serine protease [Methylococcales bacterium]MBT7410398.1 trypsin-like serine protease [Methylococcales bacterium]